MRVISLEAVIFDQDGVYADTQGIHSTIESGILRDHGIIMSPSAISARFAGVSGRDMWPTVFSEHGKECDSHERLSDLAFERLMNVPDSDIVAVDGALDLIYELRSLNVPLGVASGSRMQFIERVQRVLGIRECFKALASSKEVKRGKPYPDVCLLAAERIGVAPTVCLGIDDGIGGMIAFKAAGMYSVGLVDDMRKPYPADLLIEKLENFPTQWFR